MKTNITKTQARDMRAVALETTNPICTGRPKEPPHEARVMARAGFQRVGVGENRRRVQQYQCWECGRKTTIIPAQAGDSCQGCNKTRTIKI